MSMPLRKRVADVAAAARADDRQHADALLLVVEDCGHVVGEAEIGAVRIAGNDPDRILVDQIAEALCNLPVAREVLLGSRILG
jgi:hypothetical protein